MSRVFAYCRVSTAEQTTMNQVQEIAAAGFAVAPSRVIAETISGSVAASERKGFGMLLEKLESGDLLVVTKLDCLGGGVALTSPAGKMTMGEIAAVAEFERDLLVERTQAGLARARAEGRVLGRPRALTEIQALDARQRLAAGQAVAAVARALGASRATIMRLRDAATT